MRLTHKDKNGRYELTDTAKEDLKVALYTQVEQKLGQLEDIEEELGIDLEILLKAIILNEEIFYKDFKGNINFTENEISLNMDSDGLCLHIIHIGYFYAKDYGKTWALTKEGLENE